MSDMNVTSLGQITLVGKTHCQCVRCGSVHETQGLIIPCKKPPFIGAAEGRTCGGTDFIPLHNGDCIKSHYKRVLKLKGYLPDFAEDELLRVIRCELQSNRPSIEYLEEKCAALIRHVKKGLDNDA